MTFCHGKIILLSKHHQPPPPQPKSKNPPHPSLTLRFWLSVFYKYYYNGKTVISGSRWQRGLTSIIFLFNCFIQTVEFEYNCQWHTLDMIEFIIDFRYLWVFFSFILFLHRKRLNLKYSKLNRLNIKLYLTWESSTKKVRQIAN